MGIAENQSDEIIYSGSLMLLIALLGFVANMTNVYFSSGVAVGFSTDLRNQIFSKIQALSFAEIDKLTTASLITRLTGDISKLQTLLLMTLRLLLRAPIMILLALFFILRISPELIWIVLLSIPILAGALYIILQKGFPLFMMVQDKVDHLNSVVRENLMNIRVVKTFVREDYEKQKFTLSAQELQDKTIQAANMAVTIFPTMQLVMNVSIVLILWFGGRQVEAQKLKVGELISAVNYLIQILMSLMMLSAVFIMAVRASASSRRILEVLNTTPGLTNSDIGTQNLHQICRGEIIFQNVSFKYPDSANDVLKNINLKIDAGELVALTGATGAGKSSLLQLLCRLYDTTEGTILVDGIDIKDYHLDEFHYQVRIVLQKNELFSGTIEENIRWGNPQASDAAIQQASQIAQAAEFIEDSPQGYQTQLGRGGINLSGGQKQRVCIARALLNHPRILLLDDSTSAVDTHTERLLMNKLRHEMKGTTILMVTQRISNIHMADKIIVMDDGMIAASGTHEELLKTSTIYQEIYQSQQPR